VRGKCWLGLAINISTYVSYRTSLWYTRLAASALHWGLLLKRPNSFRLFPLGVLLHPSLKSLDPRILFRPNKLFAHRSDQGFDAGNCSIITRNVCVTAKLPVGLRSSGYLPNITYICRLPTGPHVIQRDWKQLSTQPCSIDGFFTRNSKLRLQ